MATIIYDHTTWFTILALVALVHSWISTFQQLSLFGGFKAVN